MTTNFRQKLLNSEPFQRFQSRLNELGSGAVATISGLHGSLLAFLLLAISSQRSGRILAIIPERDKAEQLFDDCRKLIKNKQVHLAVHAEHHESTHLDMSGPISHIETLEALSQGSPVVVIASVEAVVSNVPPPATVRKQSVRISKGIKTPFEEFLSSLGQLGFERKDFVEGYGDCAVRGGIVDVFPFAGEHPLRIEFFGDTVESIREFSVISQRSIRELDASTIVGKILENIGSETPPVSFLDYLDQDSLILLDEPVLAEKEIEELLKEGVRNIRSMEQLEAGISVFPRIVHSTLDSSGDIHFGSIPQPSFQGSMKVLLRELRSRAASGYSLTIACDTAAEEARIRELLEAEAERTGEPLPPGIEFTTEALHTGFVMEAARIGYLTEHEVFGRLKRREIARRPRFKGLSSREFLRLKKGDYVVHTDYGVGIFAGLQTIRVGGVLQEVMRIRYDENDTLYVNLNFIHRVQKYASREGHEPTLTKLGTPQWEKLKSRARKRIKDIARDLIVLYARRRHEAGFSFAPDSHWQRELEASFMYEDTPDQEKATEEVKKDMEAPFPMDRLICGDVGFGKTEVALRAAFKAVMSGKQVAVLVPTTILAQQHYNTFRDRLNRYAVSLDLLSRFRTKKEQQESLQRIKDGATDIVIGTHRLLSKDVMFKNLGLLVIDEEHRFGVAAKERLRALRASVDTLTLTATPIPRTLQFSLMGARDLSIIKTPPRNRLPIITEIAEFDVQLLREAILKEMHRGGQVYVIHDRIETMEEIVSLVQRHVPEARVHAAHGQMKGHELERTMVAFLEGRYDVLVCTKIIESGIDIPTVNTIIINRADRFGLAELYQLRGRVGRSNVQAFAYLFTPPLSSLPREALRRLQAIQEFSELGSGLNLAMRDLEIRGAGNLLGAEQSGFILEMGMEMYQRIVEEAVQELKEQEFEDLAKIPPSRTFPAETVVETDIESFIPDLYIESDAERLDVYRRMYEAGSPEDVNALREELQDRFGEYPAEVDHLFKSIELKIACSTLGISKVELSRNRIMLTLPPAATKQFYEANGDQTAPFQRIMDEVSQSPKLRAALNQQGDRLRLSLQIPAGSEPMMRLTEALRLIERFKTAVGTFAGQSLVDETERTHDTTS